eukprot:TRINITY_DN1542_c0_g1_i1.p1 TRINITY_DN1542_c0_g1~~TRINITY_DN1542_c0_g1_i1.p1  ORF type:complete len:708 (-),score=197.31 TRINITY_DN1542_c0_g1_i1:414-2537(-)
MLLMSSAFLAFCLAAFVSPTFCQTCSSDDFGVAYNGNTIFSVSSLNHTCMCANFASDGHAQFQNANISSLTVDTLTASISGIQVPAGVLIDLGYGAPGRQPDAGKIGYGTPIDSASLNIIGKGSLGGSRRVKLVDNVAIGDLATIDGGYTCGGVRGYYYANKQLREPYACTSLDATLQMAYGGSGLCAACNGGGVQCYGFSARWAGYVLAPVTGNVTLSVMSDDGVRLWWNDDPTPIIDAWWTQNATTFTAVVNMVQGTFYAFRLEYFQDTGAYFLMLQWSWNQTIATIPASNLCTASGVRVAAGTSRFDGQVTFNGAVFFSDGIGSPAAVTTVQGPLAVKGSATISAGLSLTGGASLDSVTVAGASVLNGAVTSNANVAITGTRTLDVGGRSTFTGAVNVGAAGASGDGNAGIAGTLAVQGSTTLAGGVSVTGGASLSSLTVSGTSTFNGAVTSNNDVAITGTRTLSVGGTSTFVGAVNFGSAGATGNSNVGIAGTLNVLGTSAFGGAANFGAAGISGAGNVGIAGALTVNGALTAGSVTTANAVSAGSASVTNALTAGSITTNGLLIANNVMTGGDISINRNVYASGCAGFNVFNVRALYTKSSANSQCSLAFPGSIAILVPATYRGATGNAICNVDSSSGTKYRTCKGVAYMYMVETNGVGYYGPSNPSCSAALCSPWPWASEGGPNTLDGEWSTGFHLVCCGP